MAELGIGLLAAVFCLVALAFSQWGFAGLFLVLLLVSVWRRMRG